MAFGFNEDKSKYDLGNIEEALAGLVNRIYPVGSIYLSTNNVNPSTVFGGTWVAWGAGRVPVGVDSNDANFNSVEKTGGAATHTLTANQIPGHTHTYAKPNGATGSTTVSASGTKKFVEYDSFHDALGAFMIALNKKVSGGISFGTYNGSNAVTGISGGAHTHSISTTSTASGSTGNGNVHNNLQPYITCYMWKRTK